MLRFILALALLAASVGVSNAEETISLGIVTTPGSAQHYVASTFKKLVEQRSGDRIRVEIYHSASLGSETDILEQVRLGAVNMAIVTLGPLDVLVPEVKVVSYPFLFGNHAEVDRVLDGPLGREVLDSLGKAGLKGLAFSENGFRHLTTGKRKVHKAGDVKGLKIRVMESTMHRELWRTLEANPTPMGWPIYAELEQGVIDAQENPLWVVDLYKLYEVQKHLTLTGHVYSAHVGLSNLRWFNLQNKDTQRLVTTCLQEAAKRQRLQSRATEAQLLDKLKAAGMEVDASPDVKSFRAKAVTLKNNPIYADDPATRALLAKFLEAVK